MCDGSFRGKYAGGPGSARSALGREFNHIFNTLNSRASEAKTRDLGQDKAYPNTSVPHPSITSRPFRRNPAASTVTAA